MYLKKLYRHNKFLFAVIVLFALAQLINNIRQDIAISPIYSYGMYSSKIYPHQFYTVPEVFVDGKQLQTKNFSPSQWDHITFPVKRFYEQGEWNLYQWQHDIHRLLPFADSTKFINTMTEDQFKEWYHRYLETFLLKNIDSVNILFANYYFNDTTFIKTR
jgi:hypothetical protein